LAVVAVLLSWHIARRDGWNFRISLLPLMLLESVAWAIPLLGVYFLFSQRTPTYQPVGDWKLMASLYLGAGVYEELIFRLAAFSLLSFFLIDLARWPVKVATPLIVVISAATFSAYHMLGIGHVPWQAFVFIALRGVFYGIIFLERGFGLSVGVHTTYDLMFLALREAHTH
jgi:membrane protease YdiL (CAAX protease family)